MLTKSYTLYNLLTNYNLITAFYTLYNLYSASIVRMHASKLQITKNLKNLLLTF